MKKIIKKFYKINKCKIIQLDSNDKMNIGYGSLNYKIVSHNKSYLLKKYSLSRRNLNFVNSENKIIHLLNKKIKKIFPQIILNINKEKLTIVKKEKAIYRMLSFIEGKFLSESKHSYKLFSNFGKILGQINKELLKLEDEAIESRKIEWDIKNLNWNRKYLEYIEDVETKKLVEYFLLQYNENVFSNDCNLRSSIIHNDANDWNILVNKDNIIGVIDFGDMVKTYMINEVAIALSYILVEKENIITWIIKFLKPYNKSIKLKSIEIDLLYYLIPARLCTTILKSSFHEKEDPSDKYITISKKGATDLLKKWITINPILLQDRIKKELEIPIKKRPSNLDLIKDRKKYLSKAYSLSYNSPIQINKAAFQYMYDSIGNTYLDAYNNVPLVGHEHPKITKSAQKQIAKLNTNTRYLYSNLSEYSKLLLKKFPKKFKKVFYVNSGSAASDLAIRIAKTYTQNKNIAILEQGYHGNTSRGINISHYKYSGKGGHKKKKNIIELPIPNSINKKRMFKSKSLLINHAIKKIEKKKSLCALIAEPIVGCAGQVFLPKNYIKKLYTSIKKLGGLYISDETQTGFGRLGKYFWGYEMHEIIPDIIILGKPIGNGHPMAAVITTEKINKSFENGMEFFSSFGGNPVSCEIGKSVLKIIEEEKLQKNALIVGNYLINKLNTLKNKFKLIHEVRGLGLFIGIEFKNMNGKPATKETKYITNQLKKEFILVSTDGEYNNVIKIKPPLCFSVTNADILIESLEKIIRKLI